MKYLSEKFESTHKQVKAADMYKSIDEIMKLKKLKKAPSTLGKVIDNDGLHALYFGGKDGKARTWKVVLECPALPADRSTLYLYCWFPSTNLKVKVDLLKIDDFCDAFTMITLLAFVQINFEDVKVFNSN